MALLKLFLLTIWVWLIQETHAFSVVGRHTLSLQHCSDAQRVIHAAAEEDDAGSDGAFPRIIKTNGVPIHLYTDDIAPAALQQLMRLAESPIPTDYISAMPDVHYGNGVTVGTVFASKDYVCPNAVGVDIGCGMAAIPIDGLYKSQLTNDDLNQMQQLIKERIPTGFQQYQSALPGSMQVIDEITADVGPTKFLEEKLLLPKVKDQLGTLGGGK